MSKYVSVPTEIEAVQFFGNNFDEIKEFCEGGFEPQDPDEKEFIAEVWDKLHDTWVGVRIGQWIIRGTKGEYYPCDEDVFQEKYRSVMALEDDNARMGAKSPTEPGFYRYSGGAQTMLFLLDGQGQWWVWSDLQSREVSQCEWGYIEQALGVWDLVKIESSDPESQSLTTKTVVEVPVQMPGNNRNWETVAGRAAILADGKIEVWLNSPESVDALIHMAENNILMQLSFDYRMGVDTLDKINTQFQKEYHNDHTIFKTRDAVHKALETNPRAVNGLDEVVNNIITSLQNAGILFRERK